MYTEILQVDVVCDMYCSWDAKGQFQDETSRSVISICSSVSSPKDTMLLKSVT